jgi:hypothetical protein
MATEIEKKEKLHEIESLTIYGLALGMWELFDDSSFATSRGIGEFLLTYIEAESGFDIEGNDPETIMKNIMHLLEDEVGMAHDTKSKMEDDHAIISCKDCSFSRGTNALEADGVQPFYCPIYNMVTSAMRDRLNKRSRFVKRLWDEDTQVCTLDIQILD